jgi:hypothetical protein
MCLNTFSLHVAVCHVVSAQENTPPELGGKRFTAIAVHNIVIAVLIKPDELLPPASRIGLEIERDEAESDSMMTLKSAEGDSLRPVGQLRHRDQIRLLARWEEKGAGHPLRDAVQDLQRKTAVYSPLYYGLHYLICSRWCTVSVSCD